MSHEANLQHMTVDDLAQQCAQETRLYFKARSHDTRYCFELFRRAISERDESAWKAIIVQYRPSVARWVNRWTDKHPDFPLAGMEEEDFIDEAFIRFWNHFTPDKFNKSQGLDGVLKYLKECVNSAILDIWRKMHREQFEEKTEEENEVLDPAELGPSPEETLQKGEIWNFIKMRLKDEKEITVVYASFFLGLSPREISAEFPSMFHDAQETYQIKQNVLRRLGREGISLDKESVATEGFYFRTKGLSERSELPISKPATKSTRITLTAEGEFGQSAHRLAPDYLMTVVSPYLKAISDLQQIIDEILGRSPSKVQINSIQQYSPISVSLDGAGEAVEVIKNTVVPWRRRHIEQLARLTIAEKEAEIEIKRAEVLERRARAEKDRLDAARQREEAEKLKLENERLRIEIHRAKIQLALDIIVKISPNMSETEKIAYLVRLLPPLDVLILSDIAIAIPK